MSTASATKVKRQSRDLKALRSTLRDAMTDLETLLLADLPDLVNPVKAALAVVAVACLKDNAQPTTLIFVAPSGAGKSMALSLLMPEDGDALCRYFYRSDKFTAASFVSHRADVSKRKLAQVDLLPRLSGKTLITSELAPLFNGKREELLERFSTLAAILDGRGFISDSGAHGRRGYAYPINFQWLGATTPLSPEALAAAAQVGPRMLFYNADRPRKTTGELVALAGSVDREVSKDRCRAATRVVALALFDRYRRGTLPTSHIAFPEDELRWLALWAEVLVKLRTPIVGSIVASEEHPERALGMLKNFAIGSAVVHGRRRVGDYDLAQVGHIALSTGVAGRARVFRAVLDVGGTATAPEIERIANISRPTALKYMKELATVRLARFTASSGPNPAWIRIVHPYRELCAAPSLKRSGGRESADA